MFLESSFFPAFQNVYLCELGDLSDQGERAVPNSDSSSLSELIPMKPPASLRTQSAPRRDFLSSAGKMRKAKGLPPAGDKEYQVDANTVGRDIVHCAIKVHSSLGPGLLETAYQKCLAWELGQLGHVVECEVSLPVIYGPITIEAGYRLDMLVNDLVIIENKTVDALLPIHQAQILTYLKMKKVTLGYLLNWHVPLMKQGIKRMVLSSSRQG
jgi:GxxExxY protein